jgi:divinyl chlorophyllide a 8-vinyl-reductase
MSRPATPPPPRLRIFMLGATGTIGQATVAALLAQGHEVVCFVRANSQSLADLPPAAILRFGDVSDPISLADEGFQGEGFDAIVSCMASRNGSPRDAWAIDFKAHSDALAVGRLAGITQMVLLSAICVQKPVLAFQKAKLAFERELMASGLTYSIIRPTAFFKSLSGQVARVSKGKAFLIFGDGQKTACKPISDSDLASYIAGCLLNETRHNAVLPIGGPGPAITPRQQGEELFRLLNRPPKFRRVPLRLLDGIVAVLAFLGHFSPRLADKAELARIGRYYATESMLVLDPKTGSYDADATPSTGNDRLVDHYARLLLGEIKTTLGDHSVF